jgi:hypothetical protein
MLPAPGEGAAGPPGPPPARRRATRDPPPDARRAAERAQAVARSGDPYAASCLFGCLVDAGADADLLSLDGGAPHLEPYLRQEGGLAAMSAGGQARAARGLGVWGRAWACFPRA